MTITRQEIERLAQLRAEAGILSASIKIDPRLGYERNQPDQKFKGAYSRFLRTADEVARGVAERERDRVLEFLRGWQPRGRGLVIYSSTPAGIWEVHPLRVMVPTWVSVANTPDTAFLARVLNEYPRMAVVMLDGGDARIYLAEQGSDREVDELDVELPNRHDQGGWSQARYARHVEFHRSAHLREVADRLQDVYYERPFDRLVLVGVDEPVKEFESLLADPIRRRLIGHINVDFKQENDDQIIERVQELNREHERKAEEELVTRIQGFADAGGRGTLGLDDTLMAIVEGRAQEVAIAEGMTQDGSVCLNCDYLSAHKFERCPVCSSSEVEDLPDIVERAIECAHIKGATVNEVFGGGRESLLARGGIGAVLRY
jgi:peptide chain release factor subunit 1